jgi:hypothetical protein
LGFDVRPIFFDDGEPHAVALRSVVAEVVIAEGALVLRARFADGRLRLQILMMSLEGVGEVEQFGFRIDFFTFDRG